MRKIKITSLLLIVAINGFFLSAEPSFSGVFAGSAGINAIIPIKEDSAEFQVPLATFAAAQVDFNESLTLRGELEIHATDFPVYKIFEGNDALIKLHEISLVYTKRAITSTHFFSIFLGSYEAIGCDTFLMRQFGIEPISSPLAKSVTNIAGVPLYSNSGAGISYIAKMDKLPLSAGGYLCFYKNADDNLESSLDLRLAVNKKLITLDFVAGLGLPLQDNGSEGDDDYVIAIKTITLHSGLNMLLGNKYSHGLLLQMGMNNLVLNGDNNFNFLESELSFVLEPRIRFKKFGVYVTIYALNQNQIKSLLYLNDPFGACATVFFDSIETKYDFMTVGLHLIASLGGEDVNFANLVSGDVSITDAEYNFYISPYVEIPLSPSSKLEFMGQLGALDVINSLKINFKFVAGFRKQF